MFNINNIIDLCNWAVAVTNPLTEDGSFHIYQLWFNEQAFGDILILLQPKVRKDFEIMFTSDRDFPRCDITIERKGFPQAWYPLEYVLEALGLPKPENTSNIEEMVPRWSIFIKDNIQKLRDAYAPENYPRTRELIEQVNQETIHGRRRI